MMGVKAIDESGKDRQKEKVKVSTQLERSVVPLDGFSQEEAKAITDVIHDIKIQDFNRLLYLRKNIGVDPIGTLKALQDEFDITFKDYRDIDFLTPQ